MFDLKARPFGLYVHWPFCVSKCPYCDFNSHVAESIDHSQWEEAYLSELDRIFDEWPKRKLSSIFFGGGTPSLMATSTAAKIIEHAQGLWGFHDDIEITLEANPNSVEAEKFRDFRAAGVNRLSIGIQALDDASLKFLGRAHSGAESFRALELANQYFDRFSFDLIYARPDQDLKEWTRELTQALGLAKDHLSLYQLTIEPGTPFYHQGMQACEEDLAAELYDLTQSILREHNMPAYEVSNHARLGQESRHNLIYWQGDDYAGLGPGAHSRLSKAGETFAIHQIYKPDLWLKGVREEKSGEQKRKTIPVPERALEIIMMGLRLNAGLDIALLENRLGLAFEDVVDHDGLKLLLEHHLLQQDDTRLRATSEGMKRLNGVLEKLIA